MKPLLIWTYHRVLPQPGNAAVTVEVFREQLLCLKKRGFTFLTTAGLADWFAGRLDKKAKYTMLTFDDGWGDNLFYATPVLQEFNLPAVMAVCSGFVNPDSKVRTKEDYQIVDSKEALGRAVYDQDFQSFLSWPEIARLRESGLWDIQAHGHSHLGCYHSLEKIKGFFPQQCHWTMEYALGEKPFPGCPRVKFISTLAEPRTRLSEDLKEQLRNSHSDAERLELCRNHPSPLENLENAEEFASRVRADLKRCRELLNSHLGQEAEALFWPWGQVSETGRKIAAELGFNLQLTMEKSAVRSGCSPMAVPRIAAPATVAGMRRRIPVLSCPVLSRIRSLFAAIKN